MDGGAPILVGVVGRPHGVRGLVHVTSYTDDPAALAAYSPLRDEAGRAWHLAWRGAGVAELTDPAGRAVADRSAAACLTNTRLFVDRDRLPAPDADEFYLADLLGLEARDTSGATLGRIIQVHDFGAGASLEIAREGGGDPLLVPFTRAAVPAVELGSGRVIVAPPAIVDRAGPSGA